MNTLTAKSVNRLTLCLSGSGFMAIIDSVKRQALRAIIHVRVSFVCVEVEGYLFGQAEE